MIGISNLAGDCFVLAMIVHTPTLIKVECQFAIKRKMKGGVGAYMVQERGRGRERGGGGQMSLQEPALLQQSSYLFILSLPWF